MQTCQPNKDRRLKATAYASAVSVPSLHTGEGTLTPRSPPQYWQIADAYDCFAWPAESKPLGWGDRQSGVSRTHVSQHTTGVSLRLSTGKGGRLGCRCEHDTLTGLPGASHSVEGSYP